MKKLLLILGMIVFTFSMNAQYRNKEYSKSVALYKAKEFVMMEVIGVEEKKQVKFDIDPLAAATSGELTSLTYTCDEKNLKGFVLGFYGNYWNEAGVLYKGYAFKNFSEDTARYILLKLATLIKSETPYLTKNNENNIYFQYEDIIYLIYNDVISGPKIRVFWDGFDSEWEFTAFERTRRRFQKNMK